MVEITLVKMTIIKKHAHLAAILSTNYKVEFGHKHRI